MDLSDLIGAELDAAVALAEGYDLRVYEHAVWIGRGTASEEFSPSTDWSQGGPIIERERIELQRHACSDGWWAGIRQPGQNKAGGTVATGPTPLIAAMRAFVAGKK